MITVSVTVVLAGVAPQVAGAIPAQKHAAALDPAARFLIGRYHISQSDALRRLDLQDRVMMLQDDLAAALGERFGGLWLDQAHGGIAVLGVRPGQEQLVRGLAAGRQVAPLALVPVQRTVAQLRALQQRLLREVSAAGGLGVRVGGLHLPTNQVDVIVDQAEVKRAGAASTSLVSRLGRDYPGAVRFRDAAGKLMLAACSVGFEKVFCDAPLRGGVGITANVMCSAGFNVRSTSDGKRYLLTAGHCDAGGLWQTRFANGEIHNIGYKHSSIFDSRGDGMLIGLLNPTGWNPKPWVIVTGSSGTTYDETYDINQPGGTTTGMAVCMTGRRDGTQCGEVIDRDTPGIRVAHVAEVSGGCIRGGDSGGSVYKRHTAFGIVHAGTFPGGDSNLCSITWFYQGVKGIMSLLNVRLVTTSNP